MVGREGQETQVEHIIKQDDTKKEETDLLPTGPDVFIIKMHLNNVLYSSVSPSVQLSPFAPNRINQNK